MRDSGLIFALGLIVRVVFIHLHPIVFGGDTILRLLNRDRILMSYQLPLLQALIYGVSRLTHDLLAIRYLMAIIGAAAGVACYWLARRFVPRPAAWGVGLLFLSNPFLIELSIVPYQEVLMLGLLCAAFAFFFAGQRVAASIALGLACLTRYEAWAACPVLLFMDCRERKSWTGAALFGWAPAVWLIAHAGLSSGASFVIELPRSFGRIARLEYLGWITAKNTQPPALILAVIGAWKQRDRRLGALAAFFALFLAAVLCSAHGVAPDPEKFVTSREATICIGAAVFLAGLALPRHPVACAALIALAVAWGLWDTQRFLIRDTSEPHVLLGYRLARYLDATLTGQERAVVMTRPVPAGQVEMYLDKIGQLGGDVEAARRKLAESDTTPEDYQRTLAHSRLGRARVISLAGNVYGPAPTAPAGVEWAAVWSDFAPSNAIEEQFRASLTGKTPVETLRAGAIEVAIYGLRN